MCIKERRGFTLIEIIIVIFLIGALSTVVSFSVIRINNANKVKTLKAAQQTILAGLETYKTKMGSYPADQQEFEDMLLNKKCQIFSSVPLNVFWNDNEHHPEKGWLYDPILLTVTPIMPSQ